MGWDFVISSSATCSGDPPEVYDKARIGSQRIDDKLLDEMYSNRDERSEPSGKMNCTPEMKLPAII